MGIAGAQCVVIVLLFYCNIQGDAAVQQQQQAQQAQNETKNRVALSAFVFELETGFLYAWYMSNLHGTGGIMHIIHSIIWFYWKLQI